MRSDCTAVHEAPFSRYCMNEDNHAQAWRREESRFTRDYNDKIFNGLVVS